MKVNILIYLFLSLLFFSCKNEDNNILQDAYNELRGGQHDKAYSILIEGQSHLEGNDLGYCYVYLASITREAGLYGKSLEYNRRALGLLEDERAKADCMKNYARVLGIVGDLEEAELFYYEAVRKYGNDSMRASTLNSYGLALSNNGYYDKAKAVLNRALSYGHLKGEIYNNIGNNELKKGNLDSAVYYLELALTTKESNYSSTYGNLAVAYLSKDDSLSYQYAHKALQSGNWDIEMLDILKSNSLMQDSILAIQQSKIDYYLKKELKQKEYKSQALYYMIKAEDLEKRNNNIIMMWSVGVGALLIIIALLSYGFIKQYRSNQWVKNLARKHFKV